MVVELSSVEKANGAWAIALAALSAAISSVALEPAVALMERIPGFQDTLIGILSPMAMSAGLVFGVIGAAFGLFRLGFRAPLAVVWLIASIVGMGAAFYVSILTFDGSRSANGDFTLSYLCASPVGALILGGPMVVFGGYVAKLKLLAALILPPTLWALVIALLMAGLSVDDALAPGWLFALYFGWQALFLGVLALWRRA